MVKLHKAASALQEPRAEGKRPDWSLWLALPRVKVWQAVALSLDMDPDAMAHSPHAWMAGPGVHASSFEKQSFADDAQEAEFEKRRRVAAANLGDHEDNDRADGPLPEFVALAVRFGWAMPDELRALEGTALPAAPESRSGSKHWTPERLAELRAHRDQHGTKITAEWAGVSEQRVRQLLPSDNPPPRGFSAFNQRQK